MQRRIFKARPFASRTRVRAATAAAFGVLLSALAPGCVRQLHANSIGLMSEQDELAWGRVADQDVRDALPVYEESPALSTLIHELGTTLAQHTERPSLPWTFRIADDPAPNAFALPGGYIYVTRGLLAHLASGDELAAVLAHEIGHVAARHAAVRQRQAQGAQRGALFSRSYHPLGDVASATSSGRLKLLRYGREHELEADDLGLRTVKAAGHSSAAVLTLFDLLGQLQAPSTVLPGYLSTHPEPDRRRAAIAAQLSGVDPTIQRSEEYTAALHGMLVGFDPREGMLDGATYLHARVGFAFDPPDGWALTGSRDGLLAIAPDKFTMVAVAPRYYQYKTAKAAMDAFRLTSAGAASPVETVDVNGVSMLRVHVSAMSKVGPHQRVVGFADYEGHVVAVMASGPAVMWTEHGASIDRALASLRPLAVETRAQIRPNRIEIVVASGEATLRVLAQRHGSPSDVERLALLNRFGPDAALPAGTSVKIIVAGES